MVTHIYISFAFGYFRKNYIHSWTYYGCVQISEKHNRRHSSYEGTYMWNFCEHAHRIDFGWKGARLWMCWDRMMQCWLKVKRTHCLGVCTHVSVTSFFWKWSTKWWNSYEWKFVYLLFLFKNIFNAAFTVNIQRISV